MSFTTDSSFDRQLQQLLDAKLHEIGQHLVEAIQTEIGTQGPPRSTPGNPPHIDTRALRDGISYTVDSDGVSVTSDQPYALDLEYGTAAMGARPFVRPVLAKSAADIQKILDK